MKDIIGYSLAILAELYVIFCAVKLPEGRLGRQTWIVNNNELYSELGFSYLLLFIGVFLIGNWLVGVLLIIFPVLCFIAKREVCIRRHIKFGQKQGVVLERSIAEEMVKKNMRWHNY